jgi:hypothetical protein
VPKAEIQQRYGCDVTDAWLRALQLASVRFNGAGSGAFVSASGLVLTNHHVASDVLGKISTKDHDFFKTGFYAPTRAAEVKAPDLELNVLVSIEEVSGRVNAAVTPGMSPAQANDARRAMMAEIEKESLAQTGLRSDVVTLYRGGRYDVYRYRKYTDVRLVFAPEFDVAFFGGDPDNFEYPRYDLDMALFRVYEDDVPVKPESFLRWSTRGVQEGDLVFASGNPGSTARLNTLAHLDSLRDHEYPYQRRRLERRRTMLRSYAARGPEQERQGHDDLFYADNSYKVLGGQDRGLHDDALMARKRHAEDALRKSVEADATLTREFGDAWDDIAKARSALAQYNVRRHLVEDADGFQSRLLGTARVLIRLAAEDQKPNGERLREFGAAGRSSLELKLYSPAPVYAEYETASLAESLAFLRDELGADDPLVKKVLDGKTPAARAEQLVAGTKLADVASRKQLAAGGQKAIDAATDPMILLARTIDPEARALRKRFEDEVEGVERGSYAKIARAQYLLEGPKQYPDATSTLRLSFGTVRGYEENGKPVPPYTDLAGMFAKGVAAGNQPPYRLPERWLATQRKLALATPLNFVTTADTVGGSSGSPIVDRKGEIVGLNFDRNSHGLVRNFVYDERHARNVAVDVRAMLEALRSIYGAGALADELVPRGNAASD